MKGFWWFIAVFFLIIASGALAQIEINEMMYDPGQCSDSDCEWIELYNSAAEAVNFSACFLQGKALEGSMEGNSFFLVVRNENEFKNNFGLSGNMLERSISLKNSGDTIILNGSDDCYDVFNYTSYLSLANGNNKTLEKDKQEAWKESLVAGGTPRNKNSVYDFNYDYSKLKITEIMPDPFGDDDSSKPLGEWVEIYNSGKDPIYLGGLVLYDKEDDHELYITNSNTDTLKLCGGCYAVVYCDSDSDFDLSKTEDKVRLYTGYPVAGSTIIDEVSFSNAVEGMSFSKFDEGWFKAKPTSGSRNIYSEGCDWDIDVEMKNSIVAGNLSFTVKVNRMVGIAQEITVRGKIEDLFGKEINDYKPWTDDKVTTSGSKTYFPNLKEGVYQLSFWFENLACNDINTGNNEVKKLIAINPQYQKKPSSLDIEKLYLGNDNSVQWGDQFTAKINIYKGDDTKTSLQVWGEKDGEKISKTTKINLYDNYKTYPVTVPIQLLPNCDQKIKDGKAKLVVTGLDLQEDEEFSILGVDEEVCKDYLKYITKTEKENTAELTYKITEIPASAATREAFRLMVQILNDDKEHKYKLWSYVYRGNKCYSCLDSSADREDNAQNIKSKPNEVKMVDFLLKLDDEMEEGEYNVKVKIKKDEQKTEKELTENIYVLQNSSVSTLTAPLVTLADSAVEENIAFPAGKRKIFLESEYLVYESNVEKAKELVPYILIVVFGLLSLVLVMKKKSV